MARPRPTAPPARQRVAAGVALALLSTGAATFGLAVPSGLGSGRSRGRVQCRAVGLQTWREAHSAAKAYEATLRAAASNASAIICELDSLFTSNLSTSQYSTPQPPANASTPEPLDIGALFTFPRPELAVPDVEKTPPLLSGEWATGKAIVGRFAGTIEMPQRRFAAEFAGTDDPAASEEENKLWREATGLVAESLDTTYFETEQRLAAVAVAEERAESRRGPVVGDLRRRVIQQMIYATDGVNSPDVLDKWLETLQTDPRLARYLALLERSALQAEELQAEIRLRQQQEREAPEGSELRSRLGEAVREAYSRTRGLDVRIRSCCMAAEEMPETLDAYDTLGKAWDEINPFKGFR